MLLEWKIGCSRRCLGLHDGKFLPIFIATVRRSSDKVRHELLPQRAANKTVSQRLTVTSPRRLSLPAIIERFHKLTLYTFRFNTGCRLNYRVHQLSLVINFQTSSNRASQQLALAVTVSQEKKKAKVWNIFPVWDLKMLDLTQLQQQNKPKPDLEKSTYHQKGLSQRGRPRCHFPSLAYN